MIRTAIFGASGYVGGELLRLCAGHPQLRAARLFGDSKAGEPVDSVHPHLGGSGAELSIDRYDGEKLDGIDLVFAALPHGRSQALAGPILERSIPFVDLGADFRLGNADDYAKWYGEAHLAPELITRFAYGIPEINREAIAGARAVAAAGCYPTAAILALKPLVDAGLVELGRIIVDAASGVTGAGRAAKEATGFANVDGSFTAYGLLTHRHTAEMEQALGGPLLFTPHLAPMARGILATCYARAKGPGDPLDVLREAYAGEPFVHVSEQPPATKWTTGSNSVHITARRDERTGHILAIAALDNLVKGAAGQMIQCANLMLGLDETSGLPLCGVHP
jgi:N-acetyl-gamma-glutamyl-phosphate reductase